jgi:cryptochrome
MTAKPNKGAAIHWFRKCLRLHDNPALLQACAESSAVYPVFIIDPKFSQGQMGVNRHSFLLQCLADLDAGLRGLGSRLFVARGRPESVLPALMKKWSANLVTYEYDSGPYSRARDAAVTLSLRDIHPAVRVCAHHSHTLFPLEQYEAKAGARGVPKSYKGFVDLFAAQGPPRAPLPPPVAGQVPPPAASDDGEVYSIPSLLELGYPADAVPTATTEALFPGGEGPALERLRRAVTERPAWVRTFSKPDTAPNSLSPSTTVLSPYLTMGCLSAARFYQEVALCRPASMPPVSLHGQLLWREYFYLCSATTPGFDRMAGNALCKQIPWERDPALLAAWREGRTGFPFIDAIMTQLRQEGWIHHLARHAVACFLTRGDLWQHWEEGARHFEHELLDGDWALNNANWQWLSCSRFFYQYGRCYSPVAFGKKTDPSGDYIRKYLPVLARMPAKYIYEPWTAPPHVQQAAGCVVGPGGDYPAPLVDHTVASQRNMGRMRKAYELGGSADASSASSYEKEQEGDGDGDAPTHAPSKKSTGKRSKPGADAADTADAATPSVSAFFKPAAAPAAKKAKGSGPKAAP